MRDSRIAVPAGMYEDASDRYDELAQEGVNGDAMMGALEDALQWLTRNPIVPTPEEFWSIVCDLKRQNKLQCDYSKEYVEFLTVHLALMKRMFASTPVRGKAAASPPAPVQK